MCKILSAKGSLKQARDPKFQALFAVRGVSANAFRLSLDQLVGPKGNKEFTDLVTVLGCNVGPKFDMSKLQYNKIVIASDADVDGLFIRSLLMAFFFKVLPDVIRDGRLYIAEPPLYRVNDKKNPFVINTADYIDRYVKEASKYYKLGYLESKDKDIEFLSKSDWAEFLGSTSSYVKDLDILAEHYKVSDRLLEMFLEEFAANGFDSKNLISDELKKINIQKMMDRIAVEFPELYYDDQRNLIRGISEGKYQSLELNESIVRRCTDIIEIIREWGALNGTTMILRDIKTGTEHQLSLLGTLKILQKYQPDIVHRFKGLGENDDADIKTTIMDPNTRTLIRVHIGDIENDMAIFQKLRGGSPADALARKQMMAQYRIPRELIDT